MLKNKSQIITGGLIVMTLGLVIAIIYITQVITGESTTGEMKSVAPQKTKAANVAYDKTVILDNITPTETVIPTAEVIPSSSITPTEVLPSGTVAPTVNNLLAYNNASISPTEIILAYNTTVTPTATDYSSSSLSATVTQTKTLPASGFINNAIIMFVAAGLIIFFSFMF